MRALAAGELTTYSTEKRYLRADGGEAWVALDVTRRAQRRRRAPVLPLADGRHRRAPRRRAGAGPERGALPHAGRRVARRHLRHRRRRPPGLRQRAPARHLRPARRGPRRHRRGWSASPPTIASAWSSEFRRARALGMRASLDVRVEAGIDRWARIHMAPVIEGARASRPGLVGTVEDVTVEVTARMALAAREAEYRMLAEHSTDFLSRHALDGTFLYASPVARAMLGWEPEAMLGQTPQASSASTTPRTWRSSSATGSGRCARSARAPRPTAPGAATARSCGWRRPSAPCAAPAARRSRWSASRATSPSARAPSSSSPTARCTTGSPGCPTARCSSTASARRCGARAGASAAWPSSSSTSTASRSSTTRSATRPATACSSTSPCA